jgi:hypothetical protein
MQMSLIAKIISGRKFPAAVAIAALMSAAWSNALAQQPFGLNEAAEETEGDVSSEWYEAVRRDIIDEYPPPPPEPQSSRSTAWLLPAAWLFTGGLATGAIGTLTGRGRASCKSNLRVSCRRVLSPTQ